MIELQSMSVDPRYAQNLLALASRILHAAESPDAMIATPAAAILENLSLSTDEAVVARLSELQVEKRIRQLLGGQAGFGHGSGVAWDTLWRALHNLEKGTAELPTDTTRAEQEADSIATEPPRLATDTTRAEQEAPAIVLVGLSGSSIASPAAPSPTTPAGPFLASPAAPAVASPTPPTFSSPATGLLPSPSLAQGSPVEELRATLGTLQERCEEAQKRFKAAEVNMVQAQIDIIDAARKDCVSRIDRADGMLANLQVQVKERQEHLEQCDREDRNPTVSVLQDMSSEIVAHVRESPPPRQMNVAWEHVPAYLIEQEETQPASDHARLEKLQQIQQSVLPPGSPFLLQARAMDQDERQARLAAIRASLSNKG